jgi:pyruvate dehydrogenase (quinone)
VDIRPEHLGIRYPTELNIWGDSQAVLSQLLPLIQPKTDTTWRDALSQELQAWDHIIDKFCDLPGEPINARVVYRELNKRLPDNLMITVDGGSTVKWFGQQIRLRRGMQADLSGRLSSMLAAMPYAMAAKFTHPDRPVLCTIGDGAFQMLAMCELITIKRYMAQWPNKQFIIMVLNNSELTEVAWEQRFEDANPMWQDAMQVEEFDYTGYAKLLGFQGIRVDDPAQVAPAWEQAFSHQGVTLLEFRTDPTVYPLAPYVPDDYVQKALQAFEKGDANFPDALNNALAALKLEWGLQNKDPHAPKMNKGRDLPPGV